MMMKRVVSAAGDATKNTNKPTKNQQKHLLHDVRDVLVVRAAHEDRPLVAVVLARLLAEEERGRADADRVDELGVGEARRVLVFFWGGGGGVFCCCFVWVLGKHMGGHVEVFESARKGGRLESSGGVGGRGERTYAHHSNTQTVQRTGAMYLLPPAASAMAAR